MIPNYRRARPARIVLAEDDRALAGLIGIAMKRTGIVHDLETVHDGHQAIAAMESKTPDLLLLDLHMPGKNGFEVLEHIKRHTRLRRTPVVMFSNSDLSADVIRAYDLHVNAYVRKTIEFADLCHTMDTILHFWLQTAMSPS
jgi:DNA-binding response OmpR family regulator